MITPERLLTLHPEDALRHMIADRYGPPSKPEWFAIQKVTTQGGSDKALALVSYNDLYVPLDYRVNRRSSMEYVWDKLDITLLSQLGPVELKLSTVYPIKPYWELMKEKYSHVGLQFAPEDFQSFLPSEVGLVSLPVSHTSLRWHGTLPVQITMQRADIKLHVIDTRAILDLGPTHRVATVLSDIVLALTRRNGETLPIALSEGSVHYTDGVPRISGNETDETNTEIELAFDHPYTGNLTVQYNRRSFYRTYTHPVKVKAYHDITRDELLALVQSHTKSSITSEELGDLVLEKETVAGRLELVERKYIWSVKPTSLAHVGEIWIVTEKLYVP